MWFLHSDCDLLVCLFPVGKESKALCTEKPELSTIFIESSGEIKSWTLTKKLDFDLWVQTRSRGGRWCWTRKRAQERSRAGRWSWAQKVGFIFCFSCSLTAVPQTLSLCSAQQLKQRLRSTLVASQWRGLHCLNIVVVLAVVHGLLGLSRVGLRG